MRAGVKFPGKLKQRRYDYYAIFNGKVQVTDWHSADHSAWQDYYVRGDKSPMKLQTVCKMLSYDKQASLNNVRYQARMQAQRKCVL